VGALLAYVLVPLVTRPDMTSWGHVLAVFIGLLAWHWLPAPAPPEAASGRGRAVWLKTVSAATVSGLAVLGLVWVGEGAMLPPVAHPFSTTIGRSEHHRSPLRTTAAKHVTEAEARAVRAAPAVHKARRPAP
jgi:hypothetical protein